MEAVAQRMPDPAWRGRVTAFAVGLLLLWPMLVYSEFKPWVLFDPQSLAAAGMFLSPSYLLSPTIGCPIIAMCARS